ncbi:MAG: hypothetical protein JO024_00480 [Candidatus Eremiobacteraeota bacterium]|nr:hypothetical protein [Candidatus Eremiobacteraeota bacterium]MBV9736548.1 hypothetical protein [Candidatus Eremiobacteraeota bacterium]
MKLFAGLDGGQSATEAIVADRDGRIIGRGKAGPADEIDQRKESTRLRDAVHGALSAALRNGGVEPDAKFVSIVAGISGYEGRVYGKKPKPNARHFSIVHDASIAHAAALGGKPGVTVICGTGTSAYGSNEDGDAITVGGWGYLFGDQGSGFWIARRALERVMRDTDAALPSQLRKPLLKHFRRKSEREIARAVYAGEIPRSAVADFAPRTMELARDGVTDARLIVDQAADTLASLAALTARRLYGNKRVLPGPVQVAFTGGLTKDRSFHDAIVARLKDRLPEATVVIPHYDNVVGALLLAYRDAHVKIDRVRE